MEAKYPSINEAAQKIIAANKIDQDHVLALRRLVFADGAVSVGEAEALFAIARCDFDNNDWQNLFIEAMTDYLVNQAEPRGYVSEDNARWIRDQIEKSADDPRAIELEALAMIVNKASSCPQDFSLFVLNKVKDGVLSGKGSLRRGLKLQPGTIGEAEVNMLRLVLYGVGGQNSIAISRAEAEVLFDINDIVGDAENHHSWPDLFVKAVANYLMAVVGYKVPTREQALRTQKWLNETEETGFTNFLSKALSGSMSAIFKGYSLDDAFAERNDKQEQAANEAEAVENHEADWLIERVNKDGLVHENERAVLNFIKEHSPDVHENLKSLLDKVA